MAPQLETRGIIHSPSDAFSLWLELTAKLVDGGGQLGCRTSAVIVFEYTDRYA